MVVERRSRVVMRQVVMMVVGNRSCCRELGIGAVREQARVGGLCTVESAERKTGCAWSVYCGHSRLLERRLVIESIADEVDGGARSSGRAVVRCARVYRGKAEEEQKQKEGKKKKGEEEEEEGR